MSTYTREQIKSALRDSDNYTSSCGGELVGDPEEHRVDALAAALGLDVEDEKPEPGTRGVVAEGPRYGYLAVVQQGGALLMFNDYGDCYRREPHEEWPTITPARVVPAAPVELSEEDVQTIHNEHPVGNYFEDLAKVDRASIVRTVNAARRKPIEASK